MPSYVLRMHDWLIPRPSYFSNHQPFGEERGARPFVVLLPPVMSANLGLDRSRRPFGRALFDPLYDDARALTNQSVSNTRNRVRKNVFLVLVSLQVPSTLLVLRPARIVHIKVCYGLLF